MELKDEIATWVRSARKQAKLSGEALAARLAFELPNARGNSKSNISHWELGKHQPSIEQLLAISKVTGHPLPPSIAENFSAGDSTAPSIKDSVAAAPGYEYFFSHITKALNERDVPPHIQSAIITLLDTCPVRQK